MQIDPLGDNAMIVRLPGLAIASIGATEAVLAAVAQLRASNIPGIKELAPAYTTIAVFYDATRVSFEALQREVSAVLDRGTLEQRAQQQCRVVEIPVCYEAGFAPDLADVAMHSGIAVADVVRMHSSAEYRVGCLGFTPGFPYLLGLAPQLATPRRRVPRREVPAGSVAIGGAQTGIYPVASPGGWNVIGRTPLRLFDITREEPSLLRAGDVVRFRAVSGADFQSLQA